MGILDFFSREAGQERRRALDSLLSQFIPPTARPQFNLLGELNPVVAMERAGQDAQRIGATQGWERVGATGDMLSNMAGVVAPALAMRGAGRPVAQAVEEGLLGFSTSPQGLALGDFVADEFGGVGFRGLLGNDQNVTSLADVRTQRAKDDLVAKITQAIDDVRSGRHQAARDAAAFELHTAGKLPLSVGTRVSTPSGWDLPSKMQIEGYWIDPQNPNRFGYKLIGEGGSTYDAVVSDPKLSLSMNDPSKFSGFKAFSGPSSNRLSYSLPQKPPQPSPQIRSPEEMARIDEEFANLFGHSGRQ